MSDEDNHEIWCRFCNEDQRMSGQYCCEEYRQDCLDKEKVRIDRINEAQSFLKRNGYSPKYGFNRYDYGLDLFDVVEWLKTKGMK